MAIAAFFHRKSMTLTQFNEIHQRLEKAGAEPNPHRLHHSCFGEDGDLMLYDIWDRPPEPSSRTALTATVDGHTEPPRRSERISPPLCRHNRPHAGTCPR